MISKMAEHQIPIRCKACWPGRELRIQAFGYRLALPQFQMDTHLAQGNMQALQIWPFALYSCETIEVKQLKQVEKLHWGLRMREGTNWEALQRPLNKNAVRRPLPSRHRGMLRQEDHPRMRPEHDETHARTIHLRRCWHLNSAIDSRVHK